MQKGANYATQELREEIVNVVNGSGLPACLIRYVLEETIAQVKQVEAQSAVKEKQEYEKSLKGDDENG